MASDTNTQPDSLVWLITGCSSGFGIEFVRQILDRGDRVIATARNPSKVANHPSLPQADDNLSLLPLDVTASQHSLNETIAIAIKMYGKIDVLVNNAGYVALGGWEDLGYDGFVKQFETNVFGLLKVTNAVLPHMRERKSGTLVFISSLSGWKGDGFCGAYGASKFAVEGSFLPFPSAFEKSLDQQSADRNDALQEWSKPSKKKSNHLASAPFSSSQACSGPTC